jgi:hypothetical protein
MNDKKILVVGASGAQGGSVARHLLSEEGVSVTCLTRNPGSDNAVALARAGAEIVEGDLNDADSVYEAAKDCWGVFGGTNFWEHFDNEFQQGKNLVDAASNAGCEYLVLSTLPYINKITKGALVVPHFDMKGQVEEYARSTGIRATYVHMAFYYENFLSNCLPRVQEDGTYGFGFPQGDTRLFKDPSTYKDRVVGIVGDDQPPANYAEIMSRILGKTVKYNYIPRDVFASFDFPGAEDLANMFEYNRLHIPDRQTDLEESRALYPGIQNFEFWLENNKDRFKL